MFFLLFLLKKKHMRKRSIFWQKPWTNPFAKCRFFLTSWELHFWGPKSFTFSPEYPKMLLFGFFLLKKIHIRKTSIFWRKQWTNPFPKCRYFLTLLELHFSGVNSILLFYPEYKEMFLSGLFCSKKKKHLKKGRFFDKNHGLTSLRNVDFWEISRTSLLRFQNLYFLSRISKNVSF